MAVIILRGSNLPPGGYRTTKHLPGAAWCLLPHPTGRLSSLFAPCVCQHPALPREQQGNCPWGPSAAGQASLPVPALVTQGWAAISTLRQAGNNVSSQGWLRTTEGAGSALPGSVPRAQGPAPADKLPLTHQQNAGLLHKEPLYQAESTTWWFFYYFLLFFFLSSWQLHVQPEARAGCAARSRHRGSRPEHPTARKSCEKGKKKGTSSAKVAEVGSELRTLRPPAAARGC